MTIKQLKAAAPLLNLSELSRVMWGEQANIKYWHTRLHRGEPEITERESAEIRKALAPILELLNV